MIVDWKSYGWAENYTQSYYHNFPLLIIVLLAISLLNILLTSTLVLLKLIGLQSLWTVFLLVVSMKNLAIGGKWLTWDQIFHGIHLYLIYKVRCEVEFQKDTVFLEILTDPYDLSHWSSVLAFSMFIATILLKSALLDISVNLASDLVIINYPWDYEIQG